MIIEDIVADTEQEATDKVRAYFRDYHPYGYGTKIVSKGTNDEGKIVVTIKRAESCD